MITEYSEFIFAGFREDEACSCNKPVEINYVFLIATCIEGVHSKSRFQNVNPVTVGGEKGVFENMPIARSAIV